jgi:hypothetical protein
MAAYITSMQAGVAIPKPHLAVFKALEGNAGECGYIASKDKFGGRWGSYMIVAASCQLVHATLRRWSGPGR